VVRVFTAVEYEDRTSTVRFWFCVDEMERLREGEEGWNAFIARVHEWTAAAGGVPVGEGVRMGGVWSE